MRKEVNHGKDGRAALVLVDEDYEPLYLECTNCYASYDPDTPLIRDWCYCPSCGAVLAYIEEVDYGAKIDGAEYLAEIMRDPCRQLTELEMKMFRIGGGR